MKKIGLAVILAILVLAAVVVTRASLLKPAPISAIPATPIALDNAGAIQRFVGAIRIPTESQFEQPPNQAAMTKLRDYLQQSFPHVHSTMQREVLPDGALLFTWKGRDPSLAPVILMGHMDVVPVPAEALPLWKHAPYSGDIADGFIWGRGTLDDKIHVLSLLEASETLIAGGFTPARTILFAFGDDEENGGNYGARNIVKLLQSRGVHPDFVVDEGGVVIRGAIPGITRPVALIGVTEKGILDLELKTTGVGGHSSAPPPHTAIGQLAAALTKLEAHPFPGSLTAAEKGQFTTLAPYMPFSKRIVLANLWLFSPLIVHMGLKDPEQAGAFHTTTAETIVSGGFKSNALPPSARAVVNFRILPGETTASVTDRVRRIVNDPGVSVASLNSFTARNPSPISPVDSNGFQTLTKSIEQLFPDAIVSPYQLNAATDSSYYTVLTPNVYRFLAVDTDTSVLAMIHGLNERIPPEKYLKTVQFTAQLIQNIH
ncbi:MAG: M20 family peptidase [Terracidiphilus sp.]|jgi:carboxypeptidase PM20D1